MKGEKQSDSYSFQLKKNIRSLIHFNLSRGIKQNNFYFLNPKKNYSGHTIHFYL